jgi:Ca2+-binding EF-hand superfamily protein/diadenosine tetraphosphatase ApaH/serine/threonine PP2A family protein phosphatase
MLWVVDHKVFVVHGGLFGRSGVSIKDIEEVDRLDYNPAPPPEPEPTSLEEEKAADLRQIMRDCLWSDPKQSPGVEFNNTRRQGQLFGPDVTAEFLNNNNLLMVVRSHECVKFGFDRPYDDAPHLLATVFSASGYSGSNNLGAYLSFRHSVAPGDKYFKVGDPALLVADSYTDSSSELFFSVNDYSVADATDSLENTNRISLRALILRKRREILHEFESRDVAKTGKIHPGEWGEAMAKATALMINWVNLLPLLDVSFDGDGLIDYALFMSELRANSALLNNADDSESLFDAMYANRATLELIFNFFDTNGDGSISKSEFRHGCEILNSKLPHEQQVSDPDALLKMMDIDGNDGIDLNEFFEVFRLVDALDGKMDGQFDILKST